MPVNPPIILIDTNIWLDYFLPSRDEDDLALHLLNTARDTDASLVFAAQSALDVYQKVRIEFKRWVGAAGMITNEWGQAIKQQAWDCVVEMRERATPVPVDSSDLYLACKFRDVHDDLEDDLVLAACERARVNYLVTNDHKLLAHAPIDAKTPDQMSRLLHMGLAKGTHVEDDPDDGHQWLYRWLSSNEHLSSPYSKN